MSGTDDREQADEELILEYELDASPEKVWRALTVSAFRDRWLPADALADAEPVSSVSGEEVCYRMHDVEPPFLASTVTFRLRPNEEGGTRFTIVHRLSDARLPSNRLEAVNGNRPPLIRAA